MDGRMKLMYKRKEEDGREDWAMDGWGEWKMIEGLKLLLLF